MLEVLGWDVANRKGLAPQYREVIAENYSSKTDRPDYSLTLRGVDDENLTICSNLGAAYAVLAKTEGENYVEEAIKYLNMAVDKKDANSAHTIAALYDPNLSCTVIEGIKSTDKAVYYYLKEIEYSGYTCAWSFRVWGF